MSPAWFFRVVVLPGLLMLAAGGGLGCYYETNDDFALTLLLRGSTAPGPVTDLHLYFHGYAGLLAALYASWPLLPWYGLLLYALLYGASVLTFAVLDRLLIRHLTPGQVVVLLTSFWVVAWLEHVLWFNYSRVPVLLAGAGLLFAAQRAGRLPALLLGLLAFGLGWLIRPSAAVLGLLVVVPGCWWLAGRRAARPLLGAAALALVGALWLSATATPAEQAYRRLDVLKSGLNDYQLYQPRPRTGPDSLGIAAVQHWLLADSTIVNEALFARAGGISTSYLLRETFPAKLTTLLSLVGRDYFPLLLLNLLLTGIVVRRRPVGSGWFWLGQLWFMGLVLGLGIVLKLPPRLGLPLFGLWTVGNLAFVLPLAQAPWRRMPVLAGLAAVVLLVYGLKSGHRVQVLSREQRGREVRLHQLFQASKGNILVTDAESLDGKGLSPFRRYSTTRPVLLLTGWTTLDPSQAALRQQLTGTRDYARALIRLRSRPGVVWVLVPETRILLKHYFQTRTRYSMHADNRGKNGP
ncbi:hypothetical protein LJY25_01535 [Hymenobacter sp. BT175]|uniref:hypothetical protein n=1 Tax=Hymenobacter translucens TaxID=2886507 RepID=UPI001D0E989C|nr:hypothetical protein [Hymenobacter translucens]MCC2545113.1 hypothetical protein [Hymenobacter translucens]